MNINSIKNDPMKLIFLLLCMFCCSLIMAQKSVKRDIMIRVMDEENNPIEQPHVAVMIVCITFYLKERLKRQDTVRFKKFG